MKECKVQEVDSGEMITVGIGDYVCFKCDIEQSGQIEGMTQTSRGVELHLYREGGFQGEYIKHTSHTNELASDCWVE